jgi:hypothetical protein
MFSSSGVWFVGGSRALSPAALEAVRVVAGALAAGGSSLVVGDARGADAAFVASWFAHWRSDVRVFCVGAPPVWAVACSCVPFAGGRPPVPVRARLARRTEAACDAAVSGGVLVCAPGARGSLVAVRRLLARGLPVFVVCVDGFVSSALPAVPGGGWLAAGSLAGFPVVRSFSPDPGF